MHTSIARSQLIRRSATALAHTRTRVGVPFRNVAASLVPKGRSAAFDLTDTHDTQPALQWFNQQISFLDTLDIKNSENFTRPAWWNEIGNTPLVPVQEGIYAKLEGYNPSGSIKDRTLTPMIMNMLANHPGTGPISICLVSSGNAALSLQKAHRELAKIADRPVRLVLVQPAAYADKVGKKNIAEGEDKCVRHEGFDAFLDSQKGIEASSSMNHVFVEATFQETLQETQKVAKKEGWLIVDQHYDLAALQGHASTACELLRDCPGLTDVVCGTGTGSTAAGLRQFLPDHVTVHSRPTESGSIDGLCDVRRYSNFCNTTKLQGYNTSPIFDPALAEMHVGILASHGIKSGPSSGASFWLARQVLEEKPTAQVAVICADGKLD